MGGEHRFMSASLSAAMDEDKRKRRGRQRTVDRERKAAIEGFLGKRNQVVTFVCLSAAGRQRHDRGMKTSLALFRWLFGAFYWPGSGQPLLRSYFPRTVRPAGWLSLIPLACAGMMMVDQAQAGSGPANPAVGPTGVIVQSQFGGQIFGFDIDQAGNEGILCEAQTLDNGRVHAAVETFNQKTGAIIKVVRETQVRDDFVTLGVVGSSVGLVEREHSAGGLRVIRTFMTLDPLSLDRFTGVWTPPVGTDHLVRQVSRTQGSPNVAVYASTLAVIFGRLSSRRMSGPTPLARSSRSQTRILSTEAIRRWRTTAR